MTMKKRSDGTAERRTKTRQTEATIAAIESWADEVESVAAKLLAVVVTMRQDQLQEREQG